MVLLPQGALHRLGHRQLLLAVLIMGHPSRNAAARPKNLGNRGHASTITRRGEERQVLIAKLPALYGDFGSRKITIS